MLLTSSLLTSGIVNAPKIIPEKESSSGNIKPTQFLWDIDIVDSIGNVAQYTSIAVDSNDNPHIAYCDTTNGEYDLMYANKIGSFWNIEPVETAGKTGLYASLALDTSNNPHISYQDGPNGDLKYAVKVGGVWNTEIVDSVGNVGWYTSLVLDSSNNPHISYHDATKALLKYTTKINGSWIFETVGDGKESSITFDFTGNLHIAFASNVGYVIHAVKNGGGWNLEVVTSEWWWYAPSIAIDSSGMIYIAYYGGASTTAFLKLAVKNGGSWSIEQVDTIGFTGGYPSIALDSIENPHIFYLEHPTTSLKYATKVNNVWVIEYVDSTGFSGLCISHVMDSNDHSHISYIDDNNHILKYAKGTPLPDLVLTNVNFDPPSPVSHGTNVSFSSTILNTGVVDAVSVTVNIRDGLSTIAEEVIPLIKAAVGIAWFNVTWFASPPFPNQMPHDICINVDPYNNITEYSELNNRFCTLIVVLGAPDLKLDDNDISLSPGGPVAKDTVIIINATVYNLGEENASNVVVRFYDGVPSPGNQIGSDQIITFIECFIGVGYAQMQWIATPLGRHDIHVMVDPDNVITEILETNNVGTRVVIVKGPDYIPWITPVSPQKVSIGNSIAISSRVMNVGIMSTTIDSTIAFYNQSAPLSPFKTDTVPPLTIGGVSPEYNATWTAPSIAGIYYVVIKVDYFDDIEEFSEANNTYEIEFNVTDKPITTINVGTPQYGTTPIYVNSSTQFWFSVVDYSGTGYTTYYCIDGPPWIQYSGAFTVAGEGPHTIDYYSVDNIGGIEDIKTYEIIVDNTPPTTIINVGDPKYVSGNTWVTSATEFTISASDTGLMPVGLNYTEYRIWNGGSWTPWSTYMTSFSLGTIEGISYVESYSIDWLGNKELINNRTYIVDNTAPTTKIQVGSPKHIIVGTWVTSNTMLTFQRTDGGLIPGGTYYTKYRIWNGSWSDWSTYFNGFSLDGDDGLRYVEFYSVDWLGNEESIQYEVFIVDNTAPITTLVVDEPKYVSGNIWITSNTQFTLNANDKGSFSVGIDYVKFRIWSNGLWSGWQNYNDGFTLKVNDGMTFIEFFSVDCLGNKEAIHNLTYYVDNSPPLTSYELQFNSDNTEASISLIADDIGSGVSYTRYQIDDGPWITYSNTFLISEPGNHIVYFQSIDNIGNVENERSFPALVLVSATKPSPAEEDEINHKPLIALIFTIILLLFGTYVSYKRPLKIVNGKKLHTWLLLVLPLVVIEALTGVISMSTGDFSIPPLLGAGMVVDLAILVFGIIIYIVIYRKFGEKSDS